MCVRAVCRSAGPVSVNVTVVAVNGCHVLTTCSAYLTSGSSASHLQPHALYSEYQNYKKELVARHEAEQSLLSKGVCLRIQRCALPHETRLGTHRPSNLSRRSTARAMHSSSLHNTCTTYSSWASLLVIGAWQCLSDALAASRSARAPCVRRLAPQTASRSNRREAMSPTLNGFSHAMVR